MFGLYYGDALYFGFRNFILVSISPEIDFEPKLSVQVVDLRTAGNISGGGEGGTNMPTLPACCTWTEVCSGKVMIQTKLSRNYQPKIIKNLEIILQNPNKWANYQKSTRTTNIKMASPVIIVS